MKRRRFLRGALGAAATATFIRPSLVRGSEASSKIEVGCIGLGGRGQLIAQKITEHGGYRIAAVADYFPEVAREVGQRFGVPPERQYSGLLGYRRLIASGVDAVFLETPPYCFPEHVAAAVDAGCHVYIAKPVAVDVPGTLAVRESARKAAEKKLVFLVDFQTRTHPFFQECVRRAHAGAIGRIGLIASVYTDDGFPDPPLTETAASRFRSLVWVNDDALGGGFIVNCAIHSLDVALWIAGSVPLSATGASSRLRRDAHGDSHDIYSVTFRFPGGLIVNHRGEHVSNQHGFICRCEAFGQDAHLIGNYEGYTGVRGGLQPFEGGDVSGLYASGIEENLKTFHASITAGDCSNSTVEPSINANLITLLGREACRRARDVTWEELLRIREKLEFDSAGLVE